MTNLASPQIRGWHEVDGYVQDSADPWSERLARFGKRSGVHGGLNLCRPVAKTMLHDSPRCRPKSIARTSHDREALRGKSEAACEKQSADCGDSRPVPPQSGETGRLHAIWKREAIFGSVRVLPREGTRTVPHPPLVKKRRQAEGTARREGERPSLARWRHCDDAGVAVNDSQALERSSPVPKARFARPRPPRSTRFRCAWNQMRQKELRLSRPRTNAVADCFLEMTFAEFARSAQKHSPRPHLAGEACALLAPIEKQPGPQGSSPGQPGKGPHRHAVLVLVDERHLVEGQKWSPAAARTWATSWWVAGCTRLEHGQANRRGRENRRGGLPEAVARAVRRLRPGPIRGPAGSCIEY
jgi:hypothetical protein